MSFIEGRKYSLRFDEESEVIDVNVVDRSEQKISLNIFKNGEEIQRVLTKMHAKPFFKNTCLRY